MIDLIATLQRILGFAPKQEAVNITPEWERYQVLLKLREHERRLGVIDADLFRQQASIDKLLGISKEEENDSEL